MMEPVSPSSPGRSKAPAFDREAFKLSLHNRSVQNAHTARSVIIEASGPPSSARKDVTQGGSLSHREFSRREGDQDTVSKAPLTARERPTDRIRGAPNTEYVDKYCSKFQDSSAYFQEKFSQSFNDRKLQRQTRVDIDGIPRSRLKTAFVVSKAHQCESAVPYRLTGWGPAMRQTYLPDLKTDSLELHEHYKGLGIEHGYKRSPSVATEKHPSSRPTTQASSSYHGRRSMEATEYRGQYLKPASATQTMYLPDGPLDKEVPGRKEALKLSLRQKRSSDLAVASRYKVMSQNLSLRRSMNRTAVQQYHAWMQGDEGTSGPPSPRPRPFTKIAVAQSDKQWDAPEHLRGLTGKQGPTLLTSHRQGMFGVRLSQNPRKATWNNYTRTHRRPHYSLAVSVEGEAMGFGA